MMSDQDAVLDLPPFEKVGRKLYFAYGAMGKPSSSKDGATNCVDIYSNGDTPKKTKTQSKGRHLCSRI